MKRKLWLVLPMMILLGLTTSAPGYAQTKPIALRFTNFLPVTFSATPVMGQFCEEIKKKTNGRVEITYYPGGTLTTAPKVYDAVVNQVADIGCSHIGYTRGRFPITEMLDLPIGMPNGFVSTHVRHDFQKKFMLKEWNDVHVLYFWSPGPGIFETTKKPIKKLEDLKGLKFVSEGRKADAVKALGAVPVAFEMGDVYDVAQRGLVDGVVVALETLKGFRLADVLKYASLTQRAMGIAYTFYVAMNKDKWNALPEDVKKIFTETVEEFVDRHGVDALKADFGGLDYFKQRGGQLVTVPDEEIQKMKNAVDPVILNYTKEMEAKGYKRSDLEEQLRYIRERIAYWGTQQRDRKLQSALDAL